MIKTIAGIEFEAIRFHSPRPHWRAKVVCTGVIMDAGVFKSGGSRAALWDSIERAAKAVGNNFAKDTLSATK